MARTNGEIVIGTALVTSEFEKDYNKLQQKLEKEEIKLNIKAGDLEEAKAELLEVDEKLRQIINRRKELNNQLKPLQDKQRDIQARIDSGEGITGNEYQKLERTKDKINELTKQQNILNKEYEKYNDLLNKANDKLTKTEGSYDIQKGKVENVKNEFTELGRKIEKANEKAKQTDLKNIQDQLNKINNTTGNVIKKVIKWGLALFSIRSAYYFIRSAVSTLSSTNEQIGADIEYIRWAIANTLKPVIETLIKLAYTLLQYINYISMAWFGVNLFANATAEAFKKSKDNLKGANKEAKELQKTLAGFDEMNILQENGSTAKGGGGGGVSLPSTDLSEMLTDVEIPGWIKWIAENGELLKGIIIGIGGAFATWKILDLLTNLKLLGEGFSSFQQLLISLGIGLIFKGIYDIINNWGEDVKGVVNGVGEVIMGLGTTLIGINPTAWWSWAILGVGFLLELIPNLIDTRSATEKLKDAQDKLNDSQKKYIDAQKTQLNAFKNAQKAKEALVKVGKDQHLTEEEVRKEGKRLYDLINDYGIGVYDELSDSEKKIYEAYLNDVDAQSQLKKAQKETQEAKKQEIRDNIEVQRYTAETTQNYKDYGEAVVKAFKEGSISAMEAGIDIKRVLDNLDDETRKVFEQNLPNELKKWASIPSTIATSMGAIGDKTKQIFAKDVPNSLDKTITKADKVLSVFDKIKTKIGILGSSGAIGITLKTNGFGNAKGGIVTKLATGAIVNRPGAGVPVASSYMGEAGREGIIPLTDAQAMETLGQAIGKYISINATIPVYAYNRQIAREIRKIEADDDFAFNR